ncbi:protein of unknown function [Cupriavidus neocaledonicus]|uniref:Uncharacterized protein n=1 Tax=Cupriavidus neocaledonicus TaxID=1040979 RepID=A0A375H2L1_9BURK|nr:protein of unknown function [Cupriavidus neocaledonicus]
MTRHLKSCLRAMQGERAKFARELEERDTYRAKRTVIKLLDSYPEFGIGQSAEICRWITWQPTIRRTPQ